MAHLTASSPSGQKQGGVSKIAIFDTPPSMRKRQLISGLSASKHYAITNSFAIYIEVVKSTISNNYCTDNFKPILPCYGFTHNRFNNSSYDYGAPDNSKYKGYIAFYAVADFHNEAIL